MEMFAPQFGAQLWGIEWSEFNLLGGGGGAGDRHTNE